MIDAEGHTFRLCLSCLTSAKCALDRRCILEPAEPYHGMIPPKSKAAAAIKANIAANLARIDKELSREDVLNEAIDVTKARGLKYGQPEDNFARIARHWGVYFRNRFGIELGNFGSRDVSVLMDLMKTGRLENEITHHDSWVDKAGYAACGAVIREDAEPPYVVLFNDVHVVDKRTNPERVPGEEG